MNLNLFSLFQRDLHNVSGYLLIACFIMPLMAIFTGFCVAKNSSASSSSMVSRKIQIKKYYNEEGKLLETESYYFDTSGKKVRHGPTTLWFSNGKKERKIHYADGCLHGLETTWDYGGNKIKEGRNKHGVSVGKWLEWYTSGKKLSESVYKNGNIDGAKRYWDENGIVFREDHYDGQGNLLEVTVWHDKEQKQMHGNFCLATDVENWEYPLWSDVTDQYPKNGRWTYWDENGKVIAEGTWKKGKPWSGICGKPTGGSLSGTLDIYSLHVGQYKDGKLIKKLKLERPTVSPVPGTN